MNPFEMVVLIVLIGGVVKIVQARAGIVRTDRGEALAPRDDEEVRQLRDALARLKDRVAVLERIVTDGDRSRGLDLEREIEALRAGEPGGRERKDWR
jgi:hypothetical protein